MSMGAAGRMAEAAKADELADIGPCGTKGLQRRRRWSGWISSARSSHSRPADGHALRRLFPDLVATTFGPYAPDGSEIVVEAADDCGGAPGTIVARADGSGRRDLGAYRTPLWSPARQVAERCLSGPSDRSPAGA